MPCPVPTIHPAAFSPLRPELVACAAKIETDVPWNDIMPDLARGI